jgi:HEAT repeat protein
MHLFRKKRNQPKKLQHILKRLPFPLPHLFFCFLILLIVVLSTHWVSAENHKSKPQTWEINGVMAALKDPQILVQAEAARWLSGYKLDNPQSLITNYEDVKNRFVQLLKYSDWDVRTAAIEGLGAIGAKDKAPGIAEIFGDPGSVQQFNSDNHIRRIAVETLGILKAKEQAPVLVGLLKDPNPYGNSYAASVNIRYAVIEALKAMEADDQVPKIAQLLTDKDSEVVVFAIDALGALRAKDRAGEIVKLLKSSEDRIREGAAKALKAMGAEDLASKEIARILKEKKEIPIDDLYEPAKKVVEANSQVSEIVKLLEDPNSQIQIAARQKLITMSAEELEKVREKLFNLFINSGNKYIRRDIARMLAKTHPFGMEAALQIISPVYRDESLIGELRFFTHFLTGGDKDVEIVLQWIGKPQNTPERLTHEQGVKTLKVLEKAWKPSESHSNLRADLAKQIAEIAVNKKVIWQQQDISLLKNHYNNLKSVGSTHTASVQGITTSLEGSKWILNATNSALKFCLVHVAFWLTLVSAYPKSRQIQAIFFWNPWVRKIMGLGYVGFALTWVPFLRHKLFEPFRESLLADAGLENFNSQAYFENSGLRSQTSGEIKPISEVISGFNGQVVLEGKSGLGKTMFLRKLCQQSKWVVVYLPAVKCVSGVIEAIQKKLHGEEIRDPKFLQSLIYSGAIAICIDGLNEVSAETRSKIVEFTENYFKGDIILATQPMEWTPPSTAKRYVMQPLSREQIREFLVSRQLLNPDYSLMKGEAYEQVCDHFLAQALDNQQSPEELAEAQRVLSNPMDLTVVASMLATGKHPDLFHLQEQEYTLMSEDYQEKHLSQEFPLEKFSEAAYQMRLNDETVLPEDMFLDEILCMEHHKMAVSRQSIDAEGKPTKEWFFRHDKIAEFFILQTFLKYPERQKQHLGDPRFRGVYFLLASFLSLDDAIALRELLIQHAADTKDHTVSDSFIQLLRSRRTA